MARKTIVTLVDDLDGSEASETVQFALDGVTYQIDLSSLNAGKLRGALAEYVACARRPDGRARAAASTAAASTAAASTAAASGAADSGVTAGAATVRLSRPASTDGERRATSGERRSVAVRAAQGVASPAGDEARTKAPRSEGGERRATSGERRTPAARAAQAEAASPAGDEARTKAPRSEGGERTIDVSRPPAVTSPFKPARPVEEPAPERTAAKTTKGAVPTVTFKAAK